MFVSWTIPRYCCLLLILLARFGVWKGGVTAFLPRPLRIATTAFVDAVEIKRHHAAAAAVTRHHAHRPMKQREGTATSPRVPLAPPRPTGLTLPNKQESGGIVSPSTSSANARKSRMVQSTAIVMGLALVATATAAVAAAATIGSTDMTAVGGSLVGGALGDMATSLRQFVTQPQVAMQNGIDGIQSMGPMGIVYFAACFVAVDVLSIPATMPLVLSAGTLFGLPQGVAIVLLSGTASACIAYWIGQTLLRSYVQDKVLTGNPKMARFDAAIAKEGFKVLFVLRIAPLFPFSLINYVYGASSIDFVSYFWGTLLGFAPSTLVYVYMGMVGQELLLEGAAAASQPWYVYAAGLTAILVLLQTITNVASGVIAAIDQEETIPTSEIR